ncbi:MAG: class I SAM-dependent methyltransferase [Gaiellaceae bacterium]
MTGETERIRRIYDRGAERYDRAEAWDRRLFGADARDLVREASGQVLELAVGTGRNLALYPADATVTGIELSDEMLRRAQARAAELGLVADLRQGDVQDLPFPDASFDTVVCTFALCTIPDDRRALREARRVLRGGGLLLLVEHVRSPNPVIRFLERLAEPVMHRIAGDHLLRDPLDHLEEAGFAVERLERSRLGVLERVRARAV